MSYKQYLDVLVDNWLIDQYDTLEDYNAALQLFNEEYKEEYSNCLEWFNDYVPNIKMDGI